MHVLIENNRLKIIQLCAEHHVKELYVFGSVVRDDFRPESDIDFLVIYDDMIAEPKVRVANEDALKKGLSELLRKEVDLVQYARIRNKYLRYFINQEKKLLYAKA
jgi:hypothetical protein